MTNYCKIFKGTTTISLTYRVNVFQGVVGGVSGVNLKGSDVWFGNIQM